MTRHGLVTWLGLIVVLGAAAVLSFSALRDLATAVRIHVELAWLLPIAVDAGAAVACSAWLSPRSSKEVARFARALTWTFLALTVAGNAAAQGMGAAQIVPPWWAAVLVGAIPPTVVGGVVHLAVLVGRNQATPVPTRAAQPVGRSVDTAAVETHQTPVAAVHATGEDADGTQTALIPAADRAAELIAEGVGRRKLARELGISEHQARALLGGLRDSPAGAR